MACGEINAGLLRDAYERSGVSVCEVARRMGAHESQVRRLLGRQVYYKYRRGERFGPYYQVGMTYGTAVRMARAMDVDPVDVGL